jgi:hypothetical protein
MANATQRVRVRCTTCDINGDHAADCPDFDVFPVSVKIRVSDDAILSAKTSHAVYFNREAENEAAVQFSSPSLPGFSQGRSLYKVGGIDEARWQRFPPDFERSMMSPQAASTPIRGLPARLDFNETMEAMNVSNAQSMIDSHATATLIVEIPKFDGQARNYGVWRDKLSLIRDTVPPALFLKVVKQKLGTIAASFVTSLGARADSADTLLVELGKQFDEYSHPMYAHQQFSSFKQGGRELTAHHAEIYQLLRGMNMDLSTTDQLLKSGYIASLSNDKIKTKLLRIVVKTNDKSTLEHLMNTACEEERIYRMGRTTAVVGSAESVLVAAAGGGAHHQKRDFRSTNSGGSGSGHPANTDSNKWCTIHEVSTHDISECKVRENTQCKYCGVKFDIGQYAEHIKSSCQGKRCHQCNKLGHVEKFCRSAKRTGGNAPTGPDSKRSRPSTGGSTSGNRPVHSATVNAATITAPQPVVQSVATVSVGPSPSVTPTQTVDNSPQIPVILATSADSQHQA